MFSVKYKIIITVAAVAVLLTLALLSPLFSVREVVITGVDTLSEQFVREALTLEGEVNLFSFNTSKAAAELKKNHFVDQVRIKKDYMGQTLSIDITERVLSCYVEMMSGQYLYLDREGRVLRSETFYTDKLPFVEGLKFSGFTVGRPLSVENPETLSTAITLAQVISEYDKLAEELVKIDMSSADCARLVLRNVEVELGGLKDIDEKIRALEAILENLPDKNMKGT
ncbi:MAG: FtsQ-type POTRA domain-containing protein, partial [Clostridiales bacterium]|nr:FtsQ-type POTRA domain-containing protein [Clostridiales bacterium]